MIKSKWHFVNFLDLHYLLPITDFEEMVMIRLSFGSDSEYLDCGYGYFDFEVEAGCFGCFER
jgi:hypothetical protein